ncbi:MAG: putative siderophore transport system ATP-binding protein YusV [Bacteroidetes bacterium ADurb.BinA261]|nr:MAG: putative siderophore transport system ATP-binding protein YusV [Bacteroidetes bacterium ADurb.BinA261]
MSHLQLQNVSIGYFSRKQPIFVQSGLNLSAREGELIALIGPNGCGKSTLIRSIACLQPLLSGTIFIDNKNIRQIPTRQRATLISVVLTDNQPPASFTVRELISIGRDPYTGWLGKLTDEDQELVDRSIDMTNLKGFEQRNVNELSDGERQRAFIARALAQDTSVILLDEPTSHLDLSNRIRILLLLQKLARDTKKIILLSTHEIETAMQVADKIWLLDKSHRVIMGTPEDMVLTGKIDDVFKNPSYEFDKEYGSFVVKKLLDKTIATRVSRPDGLMARWTTKALSRKGFRIDNQSPVELTIDDVSRSWTIRKDNLTMTAHSIDDMLQKLSSLYE